MDIQEIMNINNDKTECRELIKELMWQYCAYNIDYEIIPNPNLDYLDKNDAPYLLTPFAVYWYIKDSKDYLNSNKDFGMTLYLNENYDGLQYEYDGDMYDIENALILYVGYAQSLQSLVKILRERDFVGTTI